MRKIHPWIEIFELCACAVRSYSRCVRVYVSLLVTVILFAAAFPGIRAGLRGYDVGHLVLLRFLTASAILFVVWLLRGRPLPALADLPLIVFVGVIVTCIYPLLLGFGELSVDAGTASILVNLSPIFTALLAALFLRERITATGSIGIAIDPVAVIRSRRKSAASSAVKIGERFTRMLAVPASTLSSPKPSSSG